MSYLLLSKTPPRPPREVDPSALLPGGFPFTGDTLDLILLGIAGIIALLLIVLAVRAVRRRHMFSLDVNDEKLRWSVNIPNVFVWNVQANAEKGTAGGSVKLTFQPGTALLVSLGFLILAIVARPITQFVIPGIFLFFVIFYLRAALAEAGARVNRGVQKQVES